MCLQTNNNFHRVIILCVLLLRPFTDSRFSTNTGKLCNSVMYRYEICYENVYPASRQTFVEMGILTGNVGLLLDSCCCKERMDICEFIHAYLHSLIQGTLKNCTVSNANFRHTLSVSLSMEIVNISKKFRFLGKRAYTEIHLKNSNLHKESGVKPFFFWVKVGNKLVEFAL